MITNKFTQVLASIPAMREELGSEEVDKALALFIVLSKELDTEMDGVSCPRSVSAIINTLVSTCSDLEP